VRVSELVGKGVVTTPSGVPLVRWRAVHGGCRGNEERLHVSFVLAWCTLMFIGESLSRGEISDSTRDGGTERESSLILQQRRIDTFTCFVYIRASEDAAVRVCKEATRLGRGSGGVDQRVPFSSDRSGAGGVSSRLGCGVSE